jgi:hypothetical protein
VPFAILKHNNACGAALRPTLKEAWEAALAGDPVSAFGGVLATTAPIDKVTAEAIDRLFFEIIACTRTMNRCTGPADDEEEPHDPARKPAALAAAKLPHRPQRHPQ